MSDPSSPPPPKVSIIMATFNCEATVRDAVASIVDQTYSNWELVICDDGSTDNTYAILNDLVSELGKDRLILLRNSANRKLAYSLNRCLEVATGELIARMDADDLSMPERIATQVRYLQDHPGIDVVGTSMRRFNEHGPADVLSAPAIPDKRMMARSSAAPFFHATILARRGMFERVGNYTDTRHTVRVEDADLWFKFFAAGMEGRNLTESFYLVREDAAAIRRRSAKVRIAGYVTRVKGHRALGHPPSAYIRSTANLLKIFLPYAVFDWHRQRLRERAAAHEVRGSETP